MFFYSVEMSRAEDEVKITLCSGDKVKIALCSAVSSKAKREPLLLYSLLLF